MEIRAKSMLIECWRKLSKIEGEVTFTIDESVDVPVIMVQTIDGKQTEWVRGSQVEKVVRYGYNKIQKKCPLRHRRCIAERCSLYVIHNGTGDCSLVWTSIMTLGKSI